MAWTTPRDWTDGELVTEALLDTHVRDNLKALTEWTSYTPTWTATGGTPTIGNGSLTGRYIKAGNLCHFTVRLALGSTSSLGTTTQWAWALPFTATASSVASVFIYDVGNAYFVAAAPITSGASAFGVVSDGLSTGIGYLQPMTWSAANGDNMTVSGTYEC